MRLRNQYHRHLEVGFGSALGDRLWAEPENTLCRPGSYEERVQMREEKKTKLQVWGFIGWGLEGELVWIQLSGNVVRRKRHHFKLLVRAQPGDRVTDGVLLALFETFNQGR